MQKTKSLVKSWNLDEIISLEKWPELYNEIKQKVDKLEVFFDTTVNKDMSTEDFNGLLRQIDDITEGMARLECRAYLMESTNTKDSEATKLKNLVNDLDMFASEKLQKISSWRKGLVVEGKDILDDQNAERLFATAGDLQYALHRGRKLAKYSLDDKSENILLGKSVNGVSVINDLRDIITTEFEFHLRLPGQKKQIKETLAEINALTDSSDPAVRAEAYRARSEQFTNNIEKLFIIYQAIAKDWDYTARLRGYESPISMRNAANDVSDKAIETLMQVCENNVDIFQNFFRYKAKYLGLDKLTRFDIYAPIGEDKMQFDYPSALNLVIESYTEFSQDFADKAKQIVDANHVDSHPSSSKRDGAFCVTVAPSIKPYILLNFAGKSRDVSTIAHEFGHGIHSIYAEQHTISAQHATLPLAETASTFGEMILFERLLQTTTDIEQKKYLLASKIADSYASIIRQNYFIKFEINAHNLFAKGATEPEISQLWLDTLAEQYGDSVEVDKMFRHEWAYIPHIHQTPFYCYAYNFGELLSLSLYGMYKKEGQSFIPKLEKILTAGGSQEPAKILSEVGVDIEDANFWNSSFGIIKQWQTQLEAL